MAVPVAVGRAVGSAVGQVGIQLALEKAFFNKDVQKTTKQTENAFSKSFSGIEKTSGKTFKAIGGMIKTAFAVVGVGAITQFAKTAINAASSTQAAWTGLNSIVSGTGKSFVEAKGFIEEYVSDGLIPLEDAITAYKNLAARGYSTEQIEQTMIALKNAAAFGRQASYSYGEAIRSATEGLKNENSILVDNAGVTKNVAKMWDDYAKSIGTTADNLTQQQKIQAEVNGILEETKFQAGDAAAYANTFAGKVAKINTAFYNFKVAVGKFIAPIVELFLPYIEMALNALTRFFNKMGQVLKVFGLEMPDVISKSSGAIAGIGDSALGTADSIASTGDAASKAAKKIKRAFAGMDEINVLNMPESSSGSSGGSSGSSGTSGGGSIGGGTTTDATQFTEVTESLDSGAVKIANKIKELFEPLKKIDFTNLINAFDRLKEAATPLTEKLFSGLDWLYKNVLVPFVTWTIEDAIPSFFKALAGALDFLNGVMDQAKPYLQYLWEEFLQPIATWTGGAITKTLDWLGDKLSAIGKTLSENAPTLEEVSKKLDPIKKLLVEIGNFFVNVWERMIKPALDWWVSVIWPILKPILEFIGGWATSTFTYFVKIFTSFFEILNGIMTLDIGKIFEGVKNAFMSIGELLMDYFDLGVDLVKGLAKGIGEAFGNAFDWVKKYLFEPIVDAFKKLFGINSPSTLFAGFGKNIIEGLANGLTNAKNTILKKWNEVKSWFSDIKKEAKVEIKQKWKDIKEKWTDLTKNIKNKTADMKAKVATTWGNIKSKWNDTTKNIKDKTASMRAKVATTWSNLKSKWNSLMSNFKDKTISIKAKVGEVVGNFKTTINDKLIKPLNKKLPDFFPKIPYLAQGGWLAKNNPMLAVVGDNKHEPEIVAPESKIREQVTKGIQEAGSTNANQHFDFTIKLEYPDGKYLIKEINDTQLKDGKISLLV